jgi:hypothetical protein
MEKLKVEDPTNGMVFYAIYQGISPIEPMMRKLARRQPDNIQNLLDKVDEFINEEEALKSMRLAWTFPKKFKDKKRKESQKMDEPKPFKKGFNDYDFTPAQCQHFQSLNGSQKRPGIL